MIFLKGLLIGFSIAAPVGPIGILCIRRTLSNGWLSGFLSGLGAATADACYGAIAAYGLTFASQFLIEQKFLLRLVGGCFLLYLGVKIFMAKPKTETESSSEKKSLPKDYISTLFLTLTNPTTIFSFVAVFAGLGLASSYSGFSPATLMVLGVFFGSAAWWIILSQGVNLFRSRFNARALGFVNKLAGIIIAIFGVIALVSLL